MQSFIPEISENKNQYLLADVKLLVANRLLLQESPLTSVEEKSSRRGKSNQGAQAKCGRVRKCSRERNEDVLSSEIHEMEGGP